jgi:hypothetical protein
VKRALAIGFCLSLVYAAATGCGLNPKPDLPSGDNSSGPTGAVGGSGGSAGGIFGSGATVGAGGFPASGSGGFPEASGGFSSGLGGTPPFGADAGVSLPGGGASDAGPDADHDARPDSLHDGPDARP